MKNQQGFSLIEVMVALAIFAVYSVAIIATQSSDMNSSIRMKDDLVMLNLAKLKIDEALVNPPQFTNATDKSPDTGKFEIDGYEDYSFKVEYIKNEFPNFSELMGKSEEEQNQNDGQDQAIQKAIFEKLKKNMEEMLWQVRVTITHTPTKAEYDMSTWITNTEAKIDTNFSL